MPIVFIWKGRGFWTVLLPLFFLGVVGIGVSNSFGPPVLDRNPWLYGVAITVAAFANWVFGQRWNGGFARRVWDFRAGFNVNVRRTHTAMGLPMQVWSAPMLLLGLWLIVWPLMGGTY